MNHQAEIKKAIDKFDNVIQCEPTYTQFSDILQFLEEIIDAAEECRNVAEHHLKHLEQCHGERQIKNNAIDKTAPAGAPHGMAMDEMGP